MSYLGPAGRCQFRNCQATTVDRYAIAHLETRTGFAQLNGEADRFLTRMNRFHRTRFLNDARKHARTQSPATRAVNIKSGPSRFQLTSTNRAACTKQRVPSPPTARRERPPPRILGA